VTVPLANIRRLEALEESAATQERLVQSLRGRQPHDAGKREVYLVATAALDGFSYPGAGDTFGVTFLDREFTPATGSQAITDHPRSANAQVVARNLTGQYLPEGTICLCFFQEPPPGTTGKGKWWLFTPIDTEPQLVRFKLTASMSTGGSAAAVIRTWTGAAYADGAAITVIDWWGVSGGGRGMWQGVSGMEGWAALREGTESTYEIVWMEQYAFAVEFTLTSDFSSTTATASVTASWEQGVEPTETITVHDDLGEFTDAITGCKGVALRSEYADAGTPATPYYKVICCQRVALFLQAALTSPMCGDAPQVSAITAETQGHFVVSPGLANTTLLNSFLHRGLSGDSVLLKRTFKTKAAGKWVYEVLDVTKHATAVITGLRLKTDKSAIEGNFATAALEICTVAAWADAIALVSASYVSNVANATGVISQTKRTIYALADVSGADSTVITLTQKTFVTSVATDSDSLNKITFTAYVYSPSGDTTTDIIGLTTACP